MKTLVLRKAGDWVFFRSRNVAFTNCVRKGVLPLSYRKYDNELKCWFVWWEKLPDLVDIVSKFYHADWSQLPGSWQMLIAGGKTEKEARRRPVTVDQGVESLYTKLHLLNSAPPSVVKAAYKALLSEYHPDHNDGAGDKEKLKEVIDAYRELISTFDD